MPIRQIASAFRYGRAPAPAAAPRTPVYMIRNRVGNQRRRRHWTYGQRANLEAHQFGRWGPKKRRATGGTARMRATNHLPQTAGSSIGRRRRMGVRGQWLLCHHTCIQDLAVPRGYLTQATADGRQRFRSRGSAMVHREGGGVVAVIGACCMPHQTRGASGTGGLDWAPR